AYYRDQILSVLKNVSPDADDYDVSQLLDFAGLFALKGDSEARTLLYKYFSDHTVEDDVDFSSGTTIIETDGFPGFQFVASRLGDPVLAGDETAADDYFLVLVKGKIGDDAVKLNLEQSDDPRVAAYVAGALASQARGRERRQRSHINLTDLPYAQV